MTLYYILGVPLFIHLMLAWRTQRMIIDSCMLNPFQKRFNSVLIWTIPFFWSFLVKNLIQQAENPVKMKANRRRRKTKGNENEISPLEASAVDSSFGGF